MIFTQPVFLQLGAGLMMLVLLGLWSQTRRRRKLAAFLGGPRAAARLSRTSLYRFRVERALLLAAAAAALAAAAAEPRLQTSEPEPPPPPPVRDVVFALDISASMQAADQSPTRLGRALEVMRELMEPLAEDRVGLVLFAGKAYPLAPPTPDHDALRYLLSGVTPTMASAWDPGSLPSAGIADAVRLLPPAADSISGRTIVLISDGEAGQGLAALRAASEAAADDGVVVHAVGVGTASGAGMQLPSGPFQLGGPVVNAEGEPVRSRLRDTVLQEIAEAGNGRYAHADNEAALQALRRDLARPDRPILPPEPQPTLAQYDLTTLFAAAALLLLLADSLLDVRLPWSGFVPRRLPAARRAS